MHTHYTLHIESPASRPLVAGAAYSEVAGPLGQVPGQSNHQLIITQCHTTSAVTQRHEHQLIRTSQTSVIGAVLHSELLENVTYIYTLCSCIAVTETVASLHIATFKMIQPE